jgi:hypothetical protein
VGFYNRPVFTVMPQALPPPLPPAKPACAHCQHAARIGPGVMYCAARRDLPPAYGPLHPLRQLQKDRGASCPVFLVVE